MEVEDNIFFRLVGKYTKMTKMLFDSLARFAGSNTAHQMDFHILVNYQGLHCVTRSKGSITSNILKLSSKYFHTFEFQDHKSNTVSGFVMRVDLKDFDIAYKLLDVDFEMEIVYDDRCKQMVIQQRRENPDQFSVHKKIEITALNDSQSNLDAISASFIPEGNFPIILDFPSAKCFKFVEGVFRNLKFENLAFLFDFTNGHTQFYVENDKETCGELFRISIDKFKKIKGDNQRFKFIYPARLVHPAFSFLNKNTATTIKTDVHGTLFITSEDPATNTYTETVIPKVID